jgi:hypothetical protein
MIIETDIFEVLLGGRRFPQNLLLYGTAVVPRVASSIEALPRWDVIV